MLYLTGARYFTWQAHHLHTRMRPHLNERCQQRKACPPIESSIHHLLYLHLVCHSARIIHATLAVPACKYKSLRQSVLQTNLLLLQCALMEACWNCNLRGVRGVPAQASCAWDEGLEHSSLPGAGKMARAARNERHGERLAQDSQASALPEAVDEGRHPLVIAQSAPQVPASMICKIATSD